MSLLTGAESIPETDHAGIPSYSKKGKTGKKSKGETRILVPCTAVETLVFGDRFDPEKVYGRRRDRAKRGVKDDEVWKSVDMVDQPGEVDGGEEGRISYPPGTKKDEDAPRTSIDNASVSTDGGASVGSVELDHDVLARLSIRSGTRIRPPQNVSEVNGGVGGEKGLKEKIEETEDMLEKRREGQRRAEEREMVRCAARRGIAFGFLVERENDDGRAVEGVWAGDRRLCEAVMLGKVVESSFAKGDWSVRWRE